MKEPVERTVIDEIADSDKSDFRKFHDAMRVYKRRSFIHKDRSSDEPFVRPRIEGLPEGKAAKKRAKRDRVKAMKLAQANEQTD